ncbi:flavonol synthase/flavanone 3-hydroxylase-like [Punica granatum]|uniref:Flavonol synthase/flavanone 3-hydroxylase-like n=1 Tax=Punica granatum TaxID=22663 RepID=A0A6P8CPM4_PUNGR|nr:flavonol synthase/flavanone 3-hydroxylase-like [Punica granatum]
MAGDLAPADVVSQSEQTQEPFVEEKDLPPARYIIKGSTAGCGVVESFLPFASIPVIDLSLIALSSSSKEEEDELEKLKLALTTWGCFQVVGHGIPTPLLDKMREITEQFFDLPEADKQIYSRAMNDIEGYGTDPVLSDKQVLDWSERLFLKLLPQSSRNLNLWPETPNEFRGSLNEYSEKVKSIIDIVLGAMSRVLNLEEHYFLTKHGNQALMNARFNHYPTCTRPDLVLGAKAHTDGSGISVLLQDKEVEGLQISNNSDWFRVPIIPHALLINIGDQMQIMSNGMCKSPMHRVTANARRKRTSLVIFYLPDPEIEIEPARELVNGEKPRLYRKLKNYAAINFECFQNGKVALETVRL